MTTLTAMTTPTARTQCGCPAGSLTAVRFDGPVGFVRCGTHDVQTWTVDGAVTTRAVALASLRGMFATPRARRPARTGTSAPVQPGRAAARALRAPEPAAATASTAGSRRDGPVVDLTRRDRADGSGALEAELAALLHARGIAGVWSVA